MDSSTRRRTKATEAAAGAVGKASELSEKAKQAVDALDEKSGGKIGEARQKAEGLADKAREKLPTDKIPSMQAKGDDDQGGPA